MARQGEQTKVFTKIKQTTGKLVRTPRTKLVVLLMVAVVAVGGVRVYAETYPGGDDNGQTSRLKGLSDTLAGLGYGDTSNSPDWGAMWNRISTSAQWTPNGDAEADDVRQGKTFFSGNSRTLKTGTSLASGPCPTQAWHDGHASANQVANCTSTITWTTPSPVVTGDSKRDPRTGLIWSQCLRNVSGTVQFEPSACTSWSWDASNANNIAVGTKTAIELCSERNGGGVWRLPAQKELLQAYIDGSYYNLTSPATEYWSSTQNSASSAWMVTNNTGATASNSYATGRNVRCVR